MSHTHTNVYSKIPVTAPGRDACFTPGYQAKRGKRPEKLSFHATTTLGHLKKISHLTQQQHPAKKRLGMRVLPPPRTGYHWDPHGDPSWVRAFWKAAGQGHSSPGHGQGGCC